MTLPAVTRSRWFITGFTCGMLQFVAANANVYFQHGYNGGGAWVGFGFPFDMYVVGSFDHVRSVVWSGVVANLFIAVTASGMFGALCHKLFKPRRSFP